METAPFGGVEEVVHFGGVAAEVAHAPVVGDGVDVVVGGVVEEADGGGEGGGVFAAEGFGRAALADQLDEALIRTGDEQIVYGEGPQDGVGFADPADDGVEGGRVVFELL